KRFFDGTYYPVPWDSESWYYNTSCWRNHFAHISVENDVRIAYTPTADMGLADRQKRVRPGAYLQEYFARVLPSETIKHWVAQFSILHEDITVKYAKTADAIEKVYMRGPRSCMDARHYNAGTFKLVPFHPVR
ncbi:hypothetical protein WHL78_14560, partial [Staphylococcus aureus]|uniref:hypothetical protein n=1 Tax=Staphylococcus aureus TaxID=1280 RepID=UPI0039BE2E5C